MAILTYHHICDVPPGQSDHKGLFVPEEAFRAQMLWLRDRGYAALTLDELAQGLAGVKALPRRWVCVTFDDGFRNNFTAGLPVLQEAGFPATVFLITDRVARREVRGQWDDYLTKDDVAQMREAGIEFGSHTHTHPRLTRLESDEVRQELETSRDILRSEFHIEPRWFCYPYGNFSRRIADLVKEAGYQGALSTIRDNRVRPEQLYWMPRVMVMNDTTPERLKYMLSLPYHLVHSWKNRRRWSGIR